MVDGQSFFSSIESVRKWAHPDWAGRFIIHTTKDSARLPRRDAAERLASWLVAHPFLRVELFDDVDTSAMIQTAESGGRSVHLHYACAQTGSSRGRNASKHVCGLTNEMTVQALLHYLLATRPADWPANDRLAQALGASGGAVDASPQLPSRLDCLFRAPRQAEPSSAAPTAPTVRVCLRCPASITPFTILAPEMAWFVFRTCPMTQST